MTLARSRLLARVLASEPRFVRLCAPAGLRQVIARAFVCAPVRSSRDLRLRGESRDRSTLPAARCRRWPAKSQSGRRFDRARRACGCTRSRQTRQPGAAPCSTRGRHVENTRSLFSNTLKRLRRFRRRPRAPRRYACGAPGRTRAPYQLARSRCRSDSRTISRRIRFSPSRATSCVSIDEEAASVFEGTDLATAAVNRHRSPCRRLAHRAAAARALRPIRRQRRFAWSTGWADVDSTDSHEHLANEVLSAFTPDMMSTLWLAAAIPNASLEDISAATGIRHATPIVDRLLHLPGFISSETRRVPDASAAVVGRSLAP